MRGRKEGGIVGVREGNGGREGGRGGGDGGSDGGRGIVGVRKECSC
jgi:hypothetical protein